MMIRLAALALLGLAQFAAATGLAQSADRSIRAFDLPTLEALGRSMFEQDQQAARATDILLSERGGTDRQGIRGWIVVATATGSRVRFIRERAEAFEVAYDVTFGKDAEPRFSVPRDPRLSEEEVAHFGARTLALATIEKTCSERYNTVVLKDPEAPQWLVWALAASTKPDVIQVGGHYRFTISADGRSVLRRDQLSRSCIVIAKADVPPGAQPVAAYVTHIVSATPIETHVFLSLLHRAPLFVGGPDKRLWRVDQGRIVKMETPTPGSPRRQ